MRLSLMRIAANAAAEAMMREYEVLSQQWLTDTQNATARRHAIEQLHAGMKRKIDSGDLIVLKRVRGDPRDVPGTVVVCETADDGRGVRYSGNDYDNYTPVVLTGDACYESVGGSIKAYPVDPSAVDAIFAPLNLSETLDAQLLQPVPFPHVKPGHTVRSIRRQITAMGQSLSGEHAGGASHPQRFDAKSMLTNLLKGTLTILMTAHPTAANTHIFVFKGVGQPIASAIVRNAVVGEKWGLDTIIITPDGVELPESREKVLFSGGYLPWDGGEYTIMSVTSFAATVTAVLNHVSEISTKTSEIHVAYSVYENGVQLAETDEQKGAVVPVENKHRSSAQYNGFIREEQQIIEQKRDKLKQAVRESFTKAKAEYDRRAGADPALGDGAPAGDGDYGDSAAAAAPAGDGDSDAPAEWKIIRGLKTDVDKDENTPEMAAAATAYMTALSVFDETAFLPAVATIQDIATAYTDAFTKIDTLFAGQTAAEKGGVLCVNVTGSTETELAFYSKRLLEKCNDNDTVETIEAASRLLEHASGGKLADGVPEAITDLVEAAVTANTPTFYWLTPAPADLDETMYDEQDLLRFGTLMAPKSACWYAGCSPSARIDVFEAALVTLHNKIDGTGECKLPIDETLCNTMIVSFRGWHDTATDGSGTTALACVTSTTGFSTAYDTRTLDADAPATKATKAFYKYLLRAQTVTIRGRVERHLFVAPALVRTLGPTLNAVATTCVVEGCIRLQPAYNALMNGIGTDCASCSRRIPVAENSKLLELNNGGIVFREWLDTVLAEWLGAADDEPGALAFTGKLQLVVDMLTTKYIAQLSSKDAGAKFRDKRGQSAALAAASIAVDRFCRAV